MDPHRRIILPLDVPNLDEARKLTSVLWNSVGVLKIGLQLFLAEGPHALEIVGRTPLDVFLDLKLHDIPATVAGAVQSVAKYDVKFLTVHTSGGPAMLRAAVGAAPESMTILGVTALTSLSDEDLDYMGLHTKVRHLVRDLALMAWDQGVKGFVCSPLEVEMLRQELPPEAILVVPGIRPDAPDTPEGTKGDQKRVSSPKDAMAAGASYLVIGRPIRSAKDPVAAAEAIANEIAPYVE